MHPWATASLYGHPKPRPAVSTRTAPPVRPAPIRSDGRRAPVGKSMATDCRCRIRPKANRGEARLFQRLQISDDVVDIPGVAHPAIGHAVALHLPLRIPDIGAQIVLIPDEAGALHRVGIAEAVERGR